LEQKNNQLKALNSTKDKLFSIISHDLRSPFNAILGFQDLLLDDYYELSDTDRLGMIRQLNLTTNQVYDLVQNLLNWSRIQTSNIQSHPVKLNLKQIVNEKLDLYRNIAESKGITLNIQIPDGLFAFADNNLLETSLRNLINNAIKFTPEGGTILITANQQSDFIQISVIDSGTGMTREQMDNLFDLEKTQTKSGTNGELGSGLGLILCKEFVEKNKGILTVESQTGKGSTFRFTTPAFKPHNT
jgi:signal transduction histidine kinase